MTTKGMMIKAAEQLLIALESLMDAKPLIDSKLLPYGNDYCQSISIVFDTLAGLLGECSTLCKDTCFIDFDEEPTEQQCVERTIEAAKSFVRRCRHLLQENCNSFSSMEVRAQTFALVLKSSGTSSRQD